MSATSLWLGPFPSEANALYGRARQNGLSQLRAMVVAHIGSFRDGWVFRRKLAEIVGCSVRTVQRAITDAKLAGLIGVARGKKDETPMGGKGPLACGFSHRWTIGWGKAGELVQKAVEAARARAMVRYLLQPKPVAKEPSPQASDEAPITWGRRPKSEHHGKRYTAEELEAELAKLDAKAAAKPPPE